MMHDILGGEVIIEVLNDIRQQGDYFIVESNHSGGYVSYSRHCGGGAYQGAVGFRMVEDIIIQIDAIHKPSRLIRERFDLGDPNSFTKIGEAIKSVIDTMQIDRRNHGSVGGVEVRCRHHYDYTWSKR